MNKPFLTNSLFLVLALAAGVQCVWAGAALQLNNENQTAARYFDSDVTYPNCYFTPTEKTRSVYILVLQETGFCSIKCPANNTCRFDPFAIHALSALHANLKHSTLVSLKSQLTI